MKRSRELGSNGYIVPAVQSVSREQNENVDGRTSYRADAGIWNDPETRLSNMSKKKDSNFETFFCRFALQGRLTSATRLLENSSSKGVWR